MRPASFLMGTVNGCSLTMLAAAEAALCVLRGEMRPDFQTAAGLSGYGFAATTADTVIVDL